MFVPSTKGETSKAARIDRLMEQASEALVQTRYFECERLAVEAFTMARQGADYERMSRILLPMQEARRQKRQLAMDTKKIIRMDSMEKLEPLLTGQKSLTAGCYLIEPGLVGADGRDLREKADALEVPVIVVVREPETTIGLWPVVMVGPITVRTRVQPPARKKPDIAWMLRAGEALGDEAIGMTDPSMNPIDRVEKLADVLATVVDHEKLHQALEETCRLAATKSDALKVAARNKPRKGSATSEADRRLAADDEDDDEDD